MKKLFFLLLSCLLVLSTTSARAQTVNTANAQVLVVRLVETGSNNYLLIANGSEKPEQIYIKAALAQSANEAAVVGYQRVIANLYQQGYVLQSTLSALQEPGMPDAWRASTMIFVKVPKP